MRCCDFRQGGSLIYIRKGTHSLSFSSCLVGGLFNSFLIYTFTNKYSRNDRFCNHINYSELLPCINNDFNKFQVICMSTCSHRSLYCHICRPCLSTCSIDIVYLMSYSCYLKHLLHVFFKLFQVHFKVVSVFIFRCYRGNHLLIILLHHHSSKQYFLALPD